jgi:uncharacterized protein YndB with AHSA1/START domain
MRRARADRREPDIDIAVEIAAPAGRILEAFFDPVAIADWWRAARSVTTPRALGPYAVEWTPTSVRDDLLGRLGGVLRGTVIEVTPAEGFFVADIYWLPPDGEPIGPMALEVTLAPVSIGGQSVTRVRVRQHGFEDSGRWRRCYEVFGPVWERALASLKTLLEGGGR